GPNLGHAGLDVALAAIDVSLGGEVSLRALKKYFAGSDGTARKPHPQSVSQADVVRLRLRNGSPHPGVGKVDNGYDGLADIENFALARRTHRDGAGDGRNNFRIAQTHFGFALLLFGI